MPSELYEKIEYALGLISDGDESGVDLLYSAAGKRLFIIAKNIVGDLAEDVLQESLLKIVKNIKKYKKGSNPYAWVAKIVYNTALTASSKMRGEKDIEEYSFLSDGNVTEENSTTKIFVRELMDSLPPMRKKLVYMKYFLDMTVREIAKEIGKSKSYAAKEIALAEEQLKEALNEQKK